MQQHLTPASADKFHYSSGQSVMKSQVLDDVIHKARQLGILQIAQGSAAWE